MLNKFTRSTGVLVLGLALTVSLCACSYAPAATPTDAPAPTAAAQQATAAPEAAAPTEAPAETPDAPASTEPQYTIGKAQVKLWTNSIGSQWMQTIVPVTNTGKVNLYVDGGSFDMEGADGSLIGVQNYVSAFPQILAPGETGYIYENTSPETALEETPSIVPHPDISEATVDLIRYDVTDVSVADREYAGINVIGRVTNNTGEDASLVYVAIALYDADGAVVDVVFTVLTDGLAAGAQMGFEASSFSLPENVTAEQVADYSVWAYPMQMQI